MAGSPEVSLGVVVRTLMAAGYRIQEATRQPSHVELNAIAFDELGTEIPYVFALTDADSFTDDQILELRSVAAEQKHHLVLIAAQGSQEILSVDQLLSRLGGAVPTWRALSNDYSARLQVLGRNQLPDGLSGEPWQLFEEAVADGLEFLFGLRVNRLGARNRGARVPDGVCQTPDGAILLVDAKAAGSGFDATIDNLRALKEYAAQQASVQRGHSPLSGCLIVSSDFQQTPERLGAVGAEFLSDIGVPLGFLSTDALGQMVEQMRPNVRLRNNIRWRRVFCVAGLVDVARLDAEIRFVSQLQVSGN